MSDYKKQKGNWRLLLVGVVLGSVITVGGFWITPLDLNKAKNLIINKVNWGLGETKVITTNTETDKQGQVVKITKSEQTKSGKTIWDGLELSSRLLVPILIFIFGLWFQNRDQKKAEKQANLEREIAQNNLDEEAIQAYLDNMAKLLLNEEYKKELFPAKEQESILFLRICFYKLAVKSGLPSLMRYVSSIMEYSQEDMEELFPTKDNPVRDVARTQTITILRRLEGYTKRQDRIIHFLQDAELYGFIFKNANLSGVNLQEAKLSDANLQEA